MLLVDGMDCNSFVNKINNWSIINYTLPSRLVKEIKLKRIFLRRFIVSVILTITTSAIIGHCTVLFQLWFEVRKTSPTSGIGGEMLRNNSVLTLKSSTFERLN